MEKTTIKITTTTTIKEQFEALEGKNNGDKLVQLLDDHVGKQSLDIDSEKLKQAAEKLHTTTSDLMAIAVDSYVSKVLEGKMVEADLNAYEQLKLLMQKNDGEPVKSYITAYIFREYVRSNTGGWMNQEVINRCLRLHQVEITAHHNKHGLDINHNREKTRENNRKQAQ